MGSVVQLLEQSTNAADTSADGMRANVVELPFRKARCQIARATSTCEVLHRSIDVLQQAIEKLEGIVEMIDDGGTRESLQQRLGSMNELLLLRSAELSNIEHMLQLTLRRTHPKTHPRQPD